METSNRHTETYKISTYGLCVNVCIMFLVSLLVSTMPLLLNRESSIFYTSQPLYIAVLLLFVGVMYYRWWGILMTVFTFVICGVFYKSDPSVAFLNSSMNIVQIVLLLLSYEGIKRIKVKNRNMYSQGAFFMSFYNFVLILLFIGYLINCFSETTGATYNLLIFSAIVLLLTLIKSFVARDVRLVYYTFMIALLPSLLVSTLSSFLCNIPTDEKCSYIAVWTSSNYILLQTVGYLLYQIFFTKRIIMTKIRSILEVDVSSIVLYISTVIWNLLILGMLNNDIIKVNSHIYFFPWALGNIFLLMNLYFSNFHDAESETDKFSWYEKRVIVIENNTRIIITLISFMLPLTFNLLDSIPSYLPIFFMANIFCACLSIGLIWTPKRNVKFIALLKTLKTVFYTFSITLLMLCVIMVMSLIN